MSCSISSSMVTSKFFLTSHSLPYRKKSPSSLHQLLPLYGIILHISFKFLLPEFNPTLRHICFFTSSMTVPETAVYKNDCVVLWQNDIRLSMQLFDIYSVSESLAEKILSDLYFYRSILRFNTRHIPAPLFRG